MVTCYLRYVINPNKISEFEHYAKLWIPLVQKICASQLQGLYYLKARYNKRDGILFLFDSDCP